MFFMNVLKDHFSEYRSPVYGKGTEKLQEILCFQRKVFQINSYPYYSLDVINLWLYIFKKLFYWEILLKDNQQKIKQPKEPLKHALNQWPISTTARKSVNLQIQATQNTMLVDRKLITQKHP